MRTKRIIFATTALLVLSGCMTTEARWSSADLDNFTIDCSDPNQQAMLESQRVSREDLIKNRLIMSSLGGRLLSVLDGTYDERATIVQGGRTNNQRLTEYHREKRCAQEEFNKRYYQ